MLSHLRYFKYQALNSFWFTPSLMWLFALFMAGMTLWADHAGLGAAFLDLFQQRGWLRRETGSRVVHITATGARSLQALFPLA